MGRGWGVDSRGREAPGPRAPGVTPTLTGLGEREHIRPSDVTLSDHIEDVVATILVEDLSEVMLCGHSYGGMVVTGVADRVPERIRTLVHLDAFAPADGDSLRGLIPEFVDALLAVAAERGDGRAPIPEELLPPEDARSEWVVRYRERVRPQSTATMTEPVRLSGGVDRVPRVYVACTGYEDSVMGPFVARARSEGWLYRELEAEHDLQLFDPEGTAHLLDELARVAARS
jgi:pimeloyl-ACP methyl ester carboxylesterase